MLERIEDIQGIGLLQDASGKESTFRKETMIYVDNGSEARRLEVTIVGWLLAPWLSDEVIE